VINTLNKIQRKNIIILCHGEFEVFNQSTNEKFSFFWQFYTKRVERFFSNNKEKIANNVYFFVLGDNIKHNLKNHTPNSIFRRCCSIDQTYIFSHCKQKENTNNQAFFFGMVGQVRKGKSVSDYLSLARIFLSEINEGKAAFSIIGSVKTNREEIQAAKIEIPANSGSLSRTEYNQKISTLDYVLFFYDKDMYKFTASGPLIDALNFQKPVISLRNEYFEYMFDKYGEFGILVDSVEEMAIVIKNIITGKIKPNYPFDKIKKALSPEQIGLQFKTELSRVGLF
jgi:hypothetical protein